MKSAVFCNDPFGGMMMDMTWNALGYPCNPYLPGKEHIPDAEPHLFEERVYIYGSHDIVGTRRYCAGSYVCWSADPSNLSEWKYEGEIYAKGQDPLDPKSDRDYYAPDCVRGADGRYYLYYSINESYVLSVAVSDRPFGPFRFYGYVHDESGHVLGSAEGDPYQFDPAVLADDDGKYWLYSGQGLPIESIGGRKVMGSMVAELAPDMLTVLGQQKSITSNTHNRFDENPFFEASSIRKIDGKYYFIYSPLPNTHYLCYAVSDCPDRGFAYQGVLISNADIFESETGLSNPLNYWGNNHGSILTLGDKHYIFYHRTTNRSPYARQGCMEQLVRGAEGHFAQACMTSVGYTESLPLAGTYAAYTACHLQRKDMPAFTPYTFFEYTQEDPYITEDKKTQIPYIANLTDGAQAGFRFYNASGKESIIAVTARLHSNDAGGFDVYVNGVLTGNIPLNADAEWSRFSEEFSVDPGLTELRLVYNGPGKADLLDWTIE